MCIRRHEEARGLWLKSIYKDVLIPAATSRSGQKPPPRADVNFSWTHLSSIDDLLTPD